jgi:very-short-patch-repair endonuclease
MLRKHRKYRSSSEIMHRAGVLRKEPTPAEARLWECLRRNKLHGYNFRRQHAVGSFIADFCSPQLKLVVELDGGSHMGQAEYDLERTRYLESQGYRVIRFWNDQVMNDLEGVIRVITAALPTVPRK